MSEALSIVWAERRQPSDEREALVEVYERLHQEDFKQLPTRAEVDEKYDAGSLLARVCSTRESALKANQCSAVSTIDRYLIKPPMPWHPGMWKPVPTFVSFPVGWRSQGKCEDCKRSDVPLETHHLHYRSAGKEVPSDLLLLCHGCHHARHIRYGVFCADPD